MNWNSFRSDFNAGWKKIKTNSQNFDTKFVIWRPVEMTWSSRRKSSIWSDQNSDQKSYGCQLKSLILIFIFLPISASMKAIVKWRFLVHIQYFGAKMNKRMVDEGSCTSERFCTFILSSKNCAKSLSFFTLGRKVEDSDLAHSFWGNNKS